MLSLSQFGVVHADEKAKAGEMDAEGYTRGPLNLNHDFLFA